MKFLTFLAEAKLKGTLDNENKGVGHAVNYVLPYLSASQRATARRNFEPHLRGRKIKDGDGSLYHETKTTHELASKVGNHAAGTRVKVTGVYHENGQIMVNTKHHGSMPMSKLIKPKELAKPKVAQQGFDVEGKIAKNLGTKPAGSTKHAFDFSYGGDREKHVRGHVREVHTPKVRGESKLDRGKMGQSALSHDPKTGKWSFGNQQMASHFKKATVNGVPILQHLNTHHSNGKIDKGFSADAARGTSLNYLNSGNVNTLHIHNKKENIGTTYTIGSNSKIKGKTKLGHLNDDDIHQLDGGIHIQATQTGRTTSVHRPKQNIMKKLSLQSRTDSKNHRDLTNADHAREFIKHVDKIK